MQFFHKRLDSFAMLGDDWDGYGAKPIDPQILAVAHRLLDSLTEEDAEDLWVMPMESGAVRFEWYEEGKLLELEIDTPEQISWLQWPMDEGEGKEGVFPATDLACVKELIAWFQKSTS